MNVFGCPKSNKEKDFHLIWLHLSYRLFTAKTFVLFISLSFNLSFIYSFDLWISELLF